MRCALCHDDLAPGSELPCEGCGTLLHAECAAGLAGCPTLGCARRTQAAKPDKRGFWDVWRASCAVLATLSLIVCGGGYAWIERYRRERDAVRRAEDRAWLEERLGIDLASFAREARALHSKLRPAAERPASAAELTDFPLVGQAARGGVTLRPDGVLIEVETYLTVVVLGRPAEELAPEVRARLADPHDIEHLARFEELEPGVHVRTFTR